MKHLRLYKKHRFLFIILSKNHIGKDREQIFEGDIWTARDFAERLSLQFESQSQHEYFGGGSTISIEGVAVQMVTDSESNSRSTSFHTYFSEGKQQDSSVVFNHMQKLIKFLKKEGVLKTGSTILCNTDGCSGKFCI